MKILIVNPPAYKNKDYIREGRCGMAKDSWATLWPPLSLTYIAAILREEGHEIRLIDCIAENADQKVLQDIIKDFSPQIAIINTALPSINGDMQTAAMIKKQDNQIKTIVIGMFPTLLEDKCLKMFEQIDFGVIGEPEWTVKDLVKALDKDSSLNKVRGLIFRKNEQIHKTQPQDFASNNLDGLPLPARGLLKNECYKLPINGQKFTLVNIGRGCPHSCIFCPSNFYYGKKFRKRSINSIIDELETCQKEQGISNFLFYGESFTIDPKYGERICDEIIRRGLKIKWITTSRVDSLNDTLLRKMKQTGCILLGLGIETSSPKILERAKKNITLDQIKQGLDKVKKAKINTACHFILGLPGETEKTARETIKFACKSGIEFAQFYCAVPYPKTELGKLASENNWIETDDCSQLDLSKAIMRNETLTTKQIQKLRNLAYRKFYFRPKMVVQAIKEINSVKSFLFSLDFLKWIKLK